MFENHWGLASILKIFEKLLGQASLYQELLLWNTVPEKMQGYCKGHCA
jgi:hypothetical protein